MEFNKKFSTFKKGSQRRKRRESGDKRVMSSSSRFSQNEGQIYDKEVLSCTQRVSRISRFEGDDDIPDLKKAYINMKKKQQSQNDDENNQNQGNGDENCNDTIMELSKELEKAIENKDSKPKSQTVIQDEQNLKENVNPNTKFESNKQNLEKTPKPAYRPYQRLHNTNLNLTKLKETAKSPLLEKSKCSMTESSFHLKTKQKEDLSVHHAKANQTILKLQKEIEDLKKEKEVRDKEFRRSRFEFDGVKGSLRENRERLEELRGGIVTDQEKKEKECVQRKILY